MTDHAPGYHELRDAFVLPGCSLCRLASKAVESYIDNLLYESTNDVVLRARLRETQGFCHAHSAYLRDRVGASLSIAIIYHDVLGALLTTLSDSARGNPSGRATRLANDLGTQGTCPACQHKHEMEHLYLETLLKSDADSELWQAYQASAGLCLSHFRQTLRQTRQAVIMTRLVAAQRDCWERLRGELAEFIRKNDYRFRSEGFGSEGDSWLRAVDMISGEGVL